MADTTYTDFITPITADTMNDLNRLQYTILGDPATLAALRTTLLPFSDATAHVAGSADATKLARFEADGLTTGTTRVLTVPDRSLTLGGVLAAEVTTTGGTAIDFTGIPAGTMRITMMFAVSTSGTAALNVQIGDSGGIENTGYLSSTFFSGGGVNTASTSAYNVNVGCVAANSNRGVIHLHRQTSAHVWYASWHASDQTTTCTGVGTKTLSAELTQIRLTADSADTFDAASVAIQYE